VPDESPVSFDLRLTGASQANPASRFLKVRPHASQPREHVFELCELHLHACLARARTSRENIEDHFGSVHHPRPELELDVLSLGRRQLVVEDHQRGTNIDDAVTQLFELPFSEIRCGIWPLEKLGYFADNFRARGIG
jgi:hypothetical protein